MIVTIFFEARSILTLVIKSKFLTDYKQLLDEVFVISRIIKVEVRVISLSRFWISQKPNLIIVSLYIERTQKLGSHVSASSLTASNTNRAKLT